MTRRGVAATAFAVALVLGTLTTGASAAPAGDDAIAEAGLLTPADFPAAEGWQAGKPPPDVPSSLPACAAVRRAREQAGDRRTASPAFDRADGTAGASNVVYVFSTPAAAKRFLAPFREPRYVRCIRQSTEAQLDDERGVDVDVARTADVPGLGDQSVAFTITLSTDGIAHAVLQATAVRDGRVVDGFTFRSLDGPLTGGDALVAASLARVQQALAAA